MRGLTDSGIETRFRARLDARLERDVAHPIAVALSGGGDSMALLHLAADWAAERGRRVLAVTVDHGLNPMGGGWSAICERAARAVGADWIERRWLGDKPRTGLPAAARTARHALIAEAARAAGARVVLFAHTADDVAEGDWMRAGGSTLGRLREWSPSPAWPEGRGLMLLRPLLEARGEALRKWLSACGVEWTEDPANTDDRFARSRARRALSLRSEGDGDAKGRIGVQRLHGGATLDGVTPHPFARPDRWALGRSSLLPLGEGFWIGRSVNANVLAVVLLCASGGAAPPRGDRLRRLAARLGEGEDFIATLCGARVEARGDRVVVGREPGEMRRHPSPDVALTPGEGAVWDGRYEITSSTPGLTVSAAAGRLDRLADADRAVLKTMAAWARGALPVLIRDDGTAPVLAWRGATARALGPRRLALALGETTHEGDLSRTIHGETPPTDLFSRQ